MWVKGRAGGGPRKRNKIKCRPPVGTLLSVAAKTKVNFYIEIIARVCCCFLRVHQLFTNTHLHFVNQDLQTNTGRSQCCGQILKWLHDLIFSAADVLVHQKEIHTVKWEIRDTTSPLDSLLLDRWPHKNDWAWSSTPPTPDNKDGTSVLLHHSATSWAEREPVSSSKGTNLTKKACAHGHRKIRINGWPNTTSCPGSGSFSDPDWVHLQ